ncbi:MAG: MMPL family transporter, partial [Pseudomonadota bacterium]
RVFYSSENKLYQDLEEFEATYLPQHNIVYAVSRKPSANAKDQLAALSSLEAELWNLDSTLRVDSVLSHPTVLRNEESTFSVLPLADKYCKRGRCKPSEEWTNDHPEVLGRLVSTDSLTLAVISTHQLEREQTGRVRNIAAEATEIANRLSTAYPSLEISHTGGIPMMNAFAEAAEADSSLTIPLALIVISALLGYLTVSARVSMILMILVAAAALFTMGLAGHMGLVLNTATSVASLIVMITCLATGVHIWASYDNELSHYPPEQAASNALSINKVAVMLCTATTVTSLMSLSLADAPPLAELGLLSSIGIAFGNICCIALLPDLLWRTERNGEPSRNTHLPKIIDAALSAQRKKPIVALSSVLLIASIGLINLQIDDDFVSYFSKDTAFRQNTDRVSAKLTGPNHIEIVAYSSTGDVFSSDYIKDLEALTSFVRQNELIANAVGFSDVIRELRTVFSAPDSEAPDHLQQLYVAYQLSLGYGQSTTDLVREDLGQSRISVLLSESTSNDVKALRADIEDFAASQLSNLTVTVTGENIPVASLTETNARSMIAGLAASVLGGAALIATVFRNWRIGIAAVLALATPMIAAFGIWGWAFGKIGLAALVILSLNIGIVVDDAIHLIARYCLYRRDAGKSHQEARLLTVQRVGKALSATTLVLGIGLLVLCSSSFLVNQQLGLLSALILAISLIVDLVLLPLLLRHTFLEKSVQTQ